MKECSGGGPEAVLGEKERAIDVLGFKAGARAGVVFGKGVSGEEQRDRDGGTDRGKEKQSGERRKKEEVSRKRRGLRGSVLHNLLLTHTLVVWLLVMRLPFVSFSLSCPPPP